MNIAQFQHISKLDTGSTTFEQELIDYFQINKKQDLDKVASDLQNAMTIKPYELKGNIIKYNGKTWVIEEPFLEKTYEQWKRLEITIAEGDNIKNLHRLLAIYLRPKKWFRIEPFDLKTQTEIENELLGLDVSIANAIMSRFFLSVTKRMRNINIFYLNQMKKQKS